ncbi:sulfite exporter TauE/SafE family protein [Nannocystaceae bacterium ST9]
MQGLLAALPAFELGGVSLLGDPWLDLAVLLLAGFAAGLINVMAGGGGFLLLPVLVGLGLPANVANGTMRVGVITQSATAIATFRSKGVDTRELSMKIGPVMVLGSLIGSWAATRIDNALFEPVVGVVLLAWAIVLLIKPERFLRPPDHEREPTMLSQGLSLLVGFYGGFLQAGVGFPLLALLSGHLGYDLVRANSSKVTLTLAFTLIALPAFVLADQIAWTPALVLALTTTLGAWAGVRWQLDKGNAIVRWFVVVTVAVSGVAMLIKTFG